MNQHHHILPGNPPHGLLLGWRQPSDPIPIWDHSDEGHLITIAPTGAGKGVSCIIPALLSWQGPAIVVDPRGENYAVTAQRRRDMGQTVHVLDPFGITGADQRSSFNPLQLLNRYSLSFQDDVSAIANLLVDPAVYDSRQDPFWTERANALISLAITESIRHTPARMPVSICDAAFLIRIADIPSRHRAPNDQPYLPIPGFVNHIESITPAFSPSIGEFGTDRTRSSIFSTAASHLGFLHSAAMHLALTDGIPPADITDGAPLTIYVVIPHDKMTSHAGLLRLWIGGFLMCLGRRKTRPASPTLFLVDETAQLRQLEQLRTALTLFRGYGLRLWSFWQDMSQLKRTYSDWESILNNSSTQLFFSPPTPFARSQLDNYLCGSAPFDAFKPGRAVLISQGQTSMITRADYRHDRIFSGLAQHNPFYPTTNAELIDFPGGR